MLAPVAQERKLGRARQRSAPILKAASMAAFPHTRKKISRSALPAPAPTSIFAHADSASLVNALRAGHPAARLELFDRYSEHVQRLLVRILGTDRELADLLHEVFARALTSIEALQAPEALSGWLTGIAVLTARETLGRRSRSRWLRFFAPDDVPDIPCAPPSDEVREALRATYAVLDHLGHDDRIAFALRFIDGLELTEVASACGVSLNTVKRQLDRAQRRFLARAEREPALKDWLAEGTRWGGRI
jgi:RNA polymerase sigma-70 factor (ECF subfamily)